MSHIEIDNDQFLDDQLEIDAVIKVGGSLFRMPEFPERLHRYLRSRGGARLVLLAGGGRFVDEIRALDTLHQFDEERSHALALYAMDFTAELLRTYCSDTEVVESLDEIQHSLNAGRIPIVAPRQILGTEDRKSEDPLPHSWEVTSDSIAARLAVRLAAPELVLLKSKDASPGTTRLDAVEQGLVDPYFPIVAATIARVAIVNLRHTSIDPGFI